MKTINKVVSLLLLVLITNLNVLAQGDDEVIYVKIIDDGKTYPTLPEDCLNWPSNEIYKKAQSSEWSRSGYEPKNGDKGVIIGAYNHCNGYQIFIIKVENKYYVPIGFKGVEEISETKFRSNYSSNSGSNNNQQAIKIVNAGKIYSTLSEGCLDWPSNDIYERARNSEWKKYGYYPKAGDRGVIVGTFEHCSGYDIYLIKVNDKYYVPIGIAGVEETSNSGSDNNLQKVKITNAGSIYSTLPESCLDWPSDDIYNKSRSSEWKKHDYYPENGDRGVIIGTFEHCNGYDIYIIKVDDKYYVPIGKKGVYIY